MITIKLKRYLVYLLEYFSDVSIIDNMISAIKKIKIDLKKDQMSNEKIILFSPASASFDDFKNFEDRGKYFNYQLRKIGIDGKK